jgi:pyridoxamine 5'-phosphate oxidase
MKRDPFALFADWFSSVKDHAMTLCTAVNNQPYARIVILRDFGPKGFVFHTNYNSPKAQQLDSNPNVALLFYWKDRQVRVQGVATKLSEIENDEFFNSRNLGYRLGAWSSPQSQIVTLENLQESFEKVSTQFASSNPPRPPFCTYILHRGRLSRNSELL